MTEQHSLQQQSLSMLVTVVDRGRGQRVVDICLKSQVHIHLICLGKGTASSEILDLFGLGETEKDVVITLAPQSKVPRLFAAVNGEMHLKRPGRGVMCGLTLSGAGSRLAGLLYQDTQDTQEEEVSDMDEKPKHDMILAVMNQGHKEDAMAAARAAGATGGTVIHARNVGMEGMDKFFGISIQPEKDILMIVARREIRGAIMKAINQVAGAHTDCNGFIFSLPVDSLAGLD